MNETRWYKITPADSWFFRDSRPANAGEDQSDLHSIFPPHPQTVVGAIRAALARTLGWQCGEWNPSIKAKLGDGFEDVSPLRFTPSMLAIECEERFPRRGLQLLFTSPRHLLGEVSVDCEVNGEHQPVFCPRDWLRPSGSKFSTDMGQVYLPMFPAQADRSNSKQLQTADGFFITTTGMQSVLDGKLPDAMEFIHHSCLYAIENRVGIDRNRENRSMYSPGHVRLVDGVSIVIGIGGPSGELPEAFPLGGESRQAVCKPLTTPPKLPESRSGSCVVLTTPARWEHCWYGAGPGKSAKELHPSLIANVTTCTVDRPTRIGGFDSRTTHSQALSSYCPAGSVWWLDAVVSPADNEPCLAVGLRNSLGYGVAFIGHSPET